ncbi:hypothetical protein ABZ173_38700, partial [Streptomyces rochei]|uniref:hypothetical protein n=1 Tax=Streptomyces rochei TaxID=1928 RepID=UPI0033B8F481
MPVGGLIPHATDEAAVLVVRNATGSGSPRQGLAVRREQAASAAPSLPSGSVPMTFFSGSRATVRDRCNPSLKGILMVDIAQVTAA